MSTQEDRIIDSGRKVHRKHSNPFTAMILAFCMLFSNPPEAKAIGLNDMMDFMDMYKSMMQLGDLNNLLDYLEQFEEVMAAVEEVTAVYDQAMGIMDQIETLKNSIEAMGNYYAAYYEAQAVAALTEMLLDLANGLDILAIIDQINSTIDDVYDIADLYADDVQRLQEIADTIEDIKNRIDAFTDTISQIKDTYNQISAIYNAIANYESFMSTFSTLKNSTYMKKAIKDVKNGDPITLEVPEFDFDIDGFTEAFETLMGQMDELEGGMR